MAEDVNDFGVPIPTPGRIVSYRSRTGMYSVPAIVTASIDTLWRPGVEAGNVPDLDSEMHVHLTVFTPGKPGMRGNADDFVARKDDPISENIAGCYQEWNVPWSADATAAGCWTWPRRV